MKSDIEREDSGAADPLRQGEARTLGRARRRLGAAGFAVSAAALVALVALVGSLGGWPSAGLLLVGMPLLGLPFGLAGHRLSRRYGLSRQTAGGWLADWAKGLGVGLVLGAAAAAAAVALGRASQDLWWLWLGVAAAAVMVLLALLWPLVLLPLFLRSEPLPAGRLADELREVAGRSGVAVRDLRLLRMGEKTAAANAMVAGIGPTRRIYVSDTLLEDDDEDEAVARARVVLAHELGHQAAADVWRLVAVAAGTALAAAAGAGVAVALLAPDGPGHLTALPAAALGYAAVAAAVGPATAWYARRRERAADRFALALEADAGDAYARALERLVATNLAELWPPPVPDRLLASHPPPGERIARARAGLRAAGAG